MADTFIVLLHKNIGVISGAFTTLALAETFVGTKPNCGYEIKQVTIDAQVGNIIRQGGTGSPGSQPPVGLNSLGEAT